MQWTRRKKILLALLGLLLVVAIAVYAATRPEPLDTRFNGAYRLDDGGLAVVTPYRGGELRLRSVETGESRPLVPIEEGASGEPRFTVGETGTLVPPERQPEETVLFEPAPDGRPAGFTRRSGEGETVRARRIELPEKRLTIESGELELRAKLTLPPPSADAAAPHPAVVVVHGSGKESAVERHEDPYLFAPHGIATLVFDKRGTGGSQGSYTQNFHVLAGDVAAAVEALREREEIDPDRIHLAGYSQGGWIAPLAAERAGGIRSLLVGYGPMVPVVDEDRWGYVHALRKKGFGPEAVAEADRIHEVLVDIVDRGEKGGWDELARRLEEAEGEPWFDAVADSDSTVGFLAGNRRVPLWVLRLYAAWMTRSSEDEPFIDRLYDPVPTAAALDVPSLWIFGGDDHSMPTGWTIDELERLREAGAPIEIALYPEADHGITLYEETDEGGRRFVGYPPGYMPRKIDWLRRRSGLPEAASTGIPPAPGRAADPDRPPPPETPPS